MTNKYTRTFSDFANYPWPGKILPEYFEHPNYSDGYRGIQGMTQGIISSYGAYHIVEGASPTIAGTEWTGTAAYGMFSGVIKLLTAASGNLVAAGSYLVYNVAGTFAVTGAKPTGLILAKNIGGTVYTAARRQDVNSKEYFPNDTYHYGNIYTYGNIYGNLGDISGYEKISANSGYFSVLGGFSDITMRDSIDFDGTYHLKGVSQFTGAIISGSQITGTSGFMGYHKITRAVVTTFTGTRANFTTDITGTKALFSSDLTGARANFTTDVSGGIGTFTQLTGVSGTFGHIKTSRPQYMQVTMIPAYAGYYFNDNANPSPFIYDNELGADTGCQCSIFTSPDWDDTKDITITVAFQRGDTNNDTVAYLLSQAAESFGGTVDVNNKWGVCEDQATLLPAVGLSTGATGVFTWSGAAWNAGDMLKLRLERNEASRSYHTLTTALVKYYVA